MCPTTVCRTITLNTWHKVRIIRNGLEGSLQLDSEPFVSGRSPAPMTSLNLGEPLYLGGFRYGHTEARGDLESFICPYLCHWFIILLQYSGNFQCLMCTAVQSF